MRPSSFSLPPLALLLAAVAVGPLHGQTIAANTGSEATITAAPESHEPRISVPGHRQRGDETLLFGRVRDGVYTVDGMVAKLQLNYDVDGVKYLYMFVPGLGTAVLSAVANPDVISSEAKLKDNELSFEAGDHHFKLTGVALATDKGGVPAHLFVHLDRSAWSLNKQPMLGFGNAGTLPYLWPGALPPAQTTAHAEEMDVVPPPVPVSLLPSRKAVVPVVKPVSLSSEQPGSVALR